MEGLPLLLIYFIPLSGIIYDIDLLNEFEH